MNSAKRILAALAVVLALCVAPAANAKVDYSMDAAGGDYAPAVAAGTGGTVDYSMNAAGGTYAPAVTPAVETAAPATTDSDFAWGAAALGAGAALAVVLLISVTRTRVGTIRSRRETA